MALAIGGTNELRIADLKPKSIIKLGEGFSLSSAAIKMATEELKANLENAKQAIHDVSIEHHGLRGNIINFMEKRWKRTFALIGKSLLKKP